MDELERLARMAEAEERASAESEAVSEPEAEGQAVKSEAPEPDAAANLAETVLRLGEGAARLLVDSRLALTGEDVESGRAALSPAIEKHNLATGNGRVPYQEEITAGLWLGGLWRRARGVLSELRAADKAKRERLKRDGEERKHGTTEPAHPVHGKERAGEEPDPDTPGWDSENWGACDLVGQQQGSPGAPGRAPE